MRHLVDARTSPLKLLVGVGDLMHYGAESNDSSFFSESLLASSAAASVEEWVEVVQERVRGWLMSKGPCNTDPGVSLDVAATDNPAPNSA